MRLIRYTLPALVLCFSVPLLAQQASEFDLQTAAPPAPQATTGSQVQGPIDDSGIVPVGPRTIGTGPAATPTPAPAASPAVQPATQPSSLPSAASTPTGSRPAGTTSQPSSARRSVPVQAAPRTAAPQIVPSQGQDTPAALPSAPVPAGQSVTDPIPTTGALGEGSVAQSGPGGSDAGGIPGLAPPPAGSSEISSQAATGGSYWWWLLAALVAAIAAVAGLSLYRRKQPVAVQGLAARPSPGLMPAAAPKQGEPVKPENDQDGPSSPAVPEKTAAAPPLAAGRSVAPLGMETQVVRMQRSMMALTVTARVAITNRGSRAIGQGSLQGDLIAVNNALPLGEQLASNATTLAEIEKLGDIQPGERREVTINVRANIGSLPGIRQGSALVYIPLLRIRFTGDDVTPLSSTVLVGHPPAHPGGKPTPFPSQAPPQIYDNVIGRALG